MHRASSTGTFPPEASQRSNPSAVGGPRIVLGIDYGTCYTGTPLNIEVGLYSHKSYNSFTNTRAGLDANKG
jgi:hypothetical protein